MEKLYVEVTNRCNLRCSFCPPTLRTPNTLSLDRFDALLERIRGAARVLYFHLKGEPLLHPAIGELIDRAGTAGFAVRLTTNGTLLSERIEALRGRPALERLNVSLHSLEDLREHEQAAALRRILEAVVTLRRADPERRHLATISLRLWNRGTAKTDVVASESAVRENAASPAAARADPLIAGIEAFFELEAGSLERRLSRSRGAVIESGISAHPADRFVWPDPAAAARLPPLASTGTGSAAMSGTPAVLGISRGYSRGTCRALRDQAGILVDGTVVPCCLDGEGTIALGNIYEQPLADILETERARRLREGFRRRCIVEPLCVTCGYRDRF